MTKVYIKEAHSSSIYNNMEITEVFNNRDWLNKLGYICMMKYYAMFQNVVELYLLIWENFVIQCYIIC